MKNLRDKTHVVLWALLILFILSMTIGGLVGGANILDIISGKSKLKGAAGAVNGKELDGNHYFKLIQNEISRLRESGQETDDATADRISSQVWNSFVTETLLSEEIKRLGLYATDSEIYETLRKNPPNFLLEHEAFQTDGNFDYSKYLNVLDNPQDDEWLGVEQYLLATIPFDKIRSLIINLATVSEEEILNEYITTTVTFNLETLLFPSSLVANDTFPISRDEIQAYYAENKESYFVEETRTLDYVLFEIKPSPSDTLSAYELASNLKYRIEHGEAFETIAAEYTEDPSGVNTGGEIGWFGHGQMVPAFEKAAFSAKKGTITAPTLTRFGYHIIKVEDKRVKEGKEEVKARHILLGIKPGPGTREGIRSKSNLFAFDANEYGFSASADSNNVIVRQSNPIKAKDRHISGVGQMREAAHFAFSDIPIGTISELYSNDKGTAIFRLTAVNEAKYRPVEEVEEIIKSNLIQKKKKEKLYSFAHETYSQIIDEKKELEKIQKDYPDVKHKRHNSITLNKPIPGVGSSNSITGTILALQPEEVSKPISVGNRVFIIKMITRSEIDEEDYKIERSVLRDQLLRRNKINFYNNWENALREKAKIIDNREALFF